MEQGPTSSGRRRRGVALAALSLVFCALPLAACGSSSSSSSTNANTTAAEHNASTVTTTTATTARSYSRAALTAYRGKLEAYAGCMRSHGVDIPPAVPGRDGVPSLARATNFNREKYLAALTKCRTQVIAALTAHHSLVTTGHP
jgi:hypothetical protein